MRRECVRERECERHPYAPPTLPKKTGWEVGECLPRVTFVWLRGPSSNFFSTGAEESSEMDDQAHDGAVEHRTSNRSPCCHMYVYHNRMKAATSTGDMEQI